MSLFRRNAVKAARSRLPGRVLLAEPVSLRLSALVTAVAVCAALVYASTLSYPRRETVPGYIASSAGLASVFPQRSGVVVERLVDVGSEVKADDVLLVLDSERDASAFASHRNRLRIAEQRVAELRTQRGLEEERQRSLLARAEASLKSLDARRLQLSLQREIEQRRLALARSDRERVRQLAKQNFASDAELRSREESVLALQSTVTALDARLAELDGSRSVMQLDIDAMAERSARALSDLRLKEHELTEALIARRLEGRQQLKAPVAGTVTAIDAAPGQRLSTDQPAVSIRPRDAVLEAHLFAPSRAVGFVSVGDRVDLSVDAFPFQKHGKLSGRVASIARNQTRPAARSDIPGGRYRIVVKFEETQAIAESKLTLQLDMRVDGDLYLGDRKPIDWLLDPLRSLRF